MRASAIARTSATSSVDVIHTIDASGGKAAASFLTRSGKAMAGLPPTLASTSYASVRSGANRRRDSLSSSCWQSRSSRARQRRLRRSLPRGRRPSPAAAEPLLLGSPQASHRAAASASRRRPARGLWSSAGSTELWISSGCGDTGHRWQ